MRIRMDASVITVSTRKHSALRKNRLTSLCRGIFALPLLFSAGVNSETRYSDVAPIFKARCVICHSGQGAPKGLQLDSYERVLKGSATGPIVTMGSAEQSELIRRLNGKSLPRMPLTGPPFLVPAQIALIKDWIDGGLMPGRLPEAAPDLEPPVRANGAINYADVEPIFLKRCVKCHKDNGLRGAPPEGLRLTSYESLINTPGRTAVVAGNPGASALYRHIAGLEKPRMPFDGPPFLAADEIDLIKQWIDQGARDRSGQAASIPAGKSIRMRGILTGRWALDGVPFLLSSSTRLKKAPRVGDSAELRGRVNAQGEVVATRLRRR